MNETEQVLELNDECERVRRLLKEKIELLSRILDDIKTCLAVDDWTFNSYGELQGLPIMVDCLVSQLAILIRLRIRAERRLHGG